MAEKEVRVRLSQDGAERVKTALAGVGDGLKGIAVSAAKMGAAYFGAQGIISALKYSAQQSIAGEAAAKKLEIAYGKNTNALIRFADARQAVTAFDDDGTVAAMAAISAFTKQESAVKALTIAAQDLAAAKGMDLVSAAELLGKTFGSETNALKRSGVEVDAAAGSLERLEQITQGVAKLYGGQATAATETLAGATAQAKNAVDNMAQAIGDQMSPALRSGAGFIQRASESMMRFIDSFDTIAIDDTAEALGRLSGRTSGLVAVQREQARLKIAEKQQELNDALDDYGKQVPNAASASATLAEVEKNILNLHLQIAESVREQKSGVSGKGFWYDWEGERKNARDAIKTFERHKTNLIPVIALYEEIDALQNAITPGPTAITMEVTALSVAVEDSNKKLKVHNDLMAAANIKYRIGAEKIFIKKTSQEQFNDSLAASYLSIGESIKQEEVATEARDLWIAENGDLAKSLGMVTSSEAKAIAVTEQRLSMGNSLASNIAQMGKAWKSFAVASKRISQGMALVETYYSARKTYSSALAGFPPPANLVIAPVMAAAAVAAGLAQVRMIEQQQFASGGYVRGHGGGRSDMVPAQLSAGEGVLTAATVARIGGEAAVNALNAGAGAGGGGIVINFTGPVTDRAFVRDYIVPEVRRAVGRGVA